MSELMLVAVSSDMPYGTAINVSVVSEEAFRNLLDARGVLRMDSPSQAKVSLDRSSAYTVFAQRRDAALDIGAIKAQASRFFRAKLGLTVEKRYGRDVPETDAARIVLATDDGTTSGTRLCFGRRADSGDHAAAEAAERLQNTSGMSLLAQRCEVVWLIQIEAVSDATSSDDPVSLTIAAILASTLLGPILSPTGDEIFGVRTARMKLEGRARPYR